MVRQVLGMGPLLIFLFSGKYIAIIFLIKNSPRIAIFQIIIIIIFTTATTGFSIDSLRFELYTEPMAMLDSQIFR